MTVSLALNAHGSGALAWANAVRWAISEMVYVEILVCHHKIYDISSCPHADSELVIFFLN